MKVIVQNNQIEKAIKDLKRKLTKEGFFSEIKERRFYDKPSIQGAVKELGDFKHFPSPPMKGI